MAKRKKTSNSNRQPAEQATLKMQQLLEQGLSLHKQRQFAEAQVFYEDILKQNPRHFDALHLRGLIAYQKQDYQDALMLLSQAVEIRPDSADAYYNLGVVLQAMKAFQLTVECYDKAIAVNPDYVNAYGNRGNVLQALKQFDAALQSYNRAIELNPADAEVYSNRGIVLKELKQYEAGLESCDTAIRLQADYAEAYSNRGAVLHAMKQFDAALQSYNRAIELKGSFAHAHFNKGILNLLLGHFSEGWPGYEWRLENKEIGAFDFKRNFKEPRWEGHEDLQGKTLLLYAEQGLGDTLQFCRYATLGAERGANVILEVQPALVSLLQGVKGVSQVIAQGDAVPPFDYHCPLLSLPLAFKTDLHSIPHSQPYLKSDPNKVAAWSSRVGSKTRPRIGIVWSGNPAHKSDNSRSIALTDFIHLLSDEYEFVGLQKDIREEDQTALQAHPEIVNISAELNDFTDTAALCELMDLIISVDTSVLHLSAALGRPTWVLLADVPDWRWLLDRDDSPWYPPVKLYRQEEEGNWKDVLERVKADLRKEFGSKQ